MVDFTSLLGSSLAGTLLISLTYLLFRLYREGKGDQSEVKKGQDLLNLTVFVYVPLTVAVLFSFGKDLQISLYLLFAIGLLYAIGISYFFKRGDRFDINSAQVWHSESIYSPSHPKALQKLVKLVEKPNSEEQSYKRIAFETLLLILLAAAPVHLASAGNFVLSLIFGIGTFLSFALFVTYKGLSDMREKWIKISYEESDNPKYGILTHYGKEIRFFDIQSERYIWIPRSKLNYIELFPKEMETILEEKESSNTESK